MEWSAALYIRLSREDGDKGESESIENQRLLLYRYAQEHGFYNCCEYVDEGYSGTSFLRPSFMRMMEDINEGLINCIIVKDLSRFGREYIQTGYYLEQLFPTLGVRFIAVNDMVDTEAGGIGQSPLLLSFKNIINDEYARDISIKVKSALRAKKQSGNYACPFAPYGYRRNADLQEGIEVYKEESEVVKAIYRFREYGLKISRIANILNELAIPSPSKAKESYSLYKNPNTVNKKWSYQSVYRILNNKCYMGQFTLAKTTTISHKVGRRLKNSPENRIYINYPNLAIIDKNIAWENNGIKKNFKDSSKKNLGKYLYCAGCMSKMHIKYGGKKAYYVCYKYKREGLIGCSSHYIVKDKLEMTISNIVEALLPSTNEDGTILENLNKYSKKSEIKGIKTANNYDVNIKNNNNIPGYIDLDKKEYIFMRNHKSEVNYSTECAKKSVLAPNMDKCNMNKKNNSYCGTIQIDLYNFKKIIEKIQVISSNEIVLWLK